MKVSLERTESTGQDIKALKGQRHQKSSGQGCWGRAAGSGHQGQGKWVRTSRTGKLGQDIKDRAAGTGQPIEDNAGTTALRDQTKQARLDRTDGQDTWNGTAGTYRSA